MNQNNRNKLNVFVIFIVLSVSAGWAQSDLKTVNKTVTFGIREVENRNIDVIIVHSVYNALGGDKYDIDLIIKQFEKYDVSSHYVIGREGTIYQLVMEKNISYQAGKSQLPDGRTAVNSCSLGIELITSKDSLDAPTMPQIKALAMLIKNIKSRYQIKYVLRHSDIAPGRKTDPWNMDWVEFQKSLKSN